MTRKEEILQVKSLGDSIGYGNLMTIASALWRYDLKIKNYPIEGAFVARIGKLDKYDRLHDKEIAKLLSNKFNP